MIIARVISGVVVNLEVADMEWLSANQDSSDGAQFVPVPDGVLATIGLGWSEAFGFEQPPVPDFVPDETDLLVEQALAGE